MKFIFCMLFGMSAWGSEYWLFQEDFIKLGKKDFYQEQKSKELKEDMVAAQNLENSQVLFFMPLESLNALAHPLERKPGALLASCLHFQIFSLQKQLKECSLEGSFTLRRPYLLRTTYEVTFGGGAGFEEMLKKSVAKAKGHFASWKSLIAGDVPRYIVVSSFSTKDELEKADGDEIFDEESVKDLIRGKKNVWMKLLPALSKGYTLE
jgi:hypothetical protein